MKGHHGQFTTGFQRPLCGHKPLKQLTIFIIHRNAQRLKTARGRMTLTGLGTRQTALNQARQLKRCGDRCLIARARDRFGNPSARPLFAELKQNAGNQLFFIGVHNIRR